MLKPKSKDARRKSLMATRKSIKASQEGGNMIFFKADTTTRIRVLPVDEDKEFGQEVVHFFLGQEIKGVVSPMTFGEPCAIYEKYEELKNGDDDDKALAAKLKPKRKFVVPAIKYEDKMGKKVDEKIGAKLAQLTVGQYQDLIDLYLDEENGDFTNPKSGYDVKITRTGSGMMDTEYSMLAGKSSPLSPKYNKIYDLEAMVRKEIPTYEETQEILNRFLGIGEKKKVKKGTTLVKKKKRLG